MTTPPNTCAASLRKTLEERAAEMGIDLSLLETRLRMTPDERVRAHESARKLAEKLRRAGEEARVRALLPTATSTRPGP